MSEPLTHHPLGAPVVLERGIKNANFFNGRVLTARDLQDEQLANRQQHRQLGRAAGAGVVDGMEVQLVAAGSPTTHPVLSVRGGLAINRSGQAIELSVELVQVALARTLAAPSEAGLFADCEPLQSTPDLVGKGVYLFTIAPDPPSVVPEHPLPLVEVTSMLELHDGRLLLAVRSNADGLVGESRPSRLFQLTPAASDPVPF